MTNERGHPKMNAVAIEVLREAVPMPRPRSNVLVFVEPDGRRSNAMSKERKALDLLLTRWAHCWMSAFDSLGYPRQSVYVRVGALGTRVANEFVTVLQMPDDLMEVDRAVLQLRDIRRQVVIHRYIHWVSREKAAKACNMSEARFSYVLKSACETLQDLLQDLILRTTRNI
jgi:hypothetical protein